jgi:holo-[acyl-carrier protein] synthase
MIAGIGIDMIEVERVASKIKKEKGFREFVFSENEIDYCESKPKKYEHYAACFAGKEAFLKAMGTGWSNGVAFVEIEIIHEPGGKPTIELKGKTAELASTNGPFSMTISLTHLNNIAAAVVILEK